MPSTSTETSPTLSILTISGWGQGAGALLPLFPNTPATCLDYAQLTGLEAVFSALAGQAPDVIVGWSLGGQLAARAVAAGCLKPKLLVLLATPFQFINSLDVPYGMPTLQFQAFEQAFALTPGIVLQRFAAMMAFQDSHAREIAALLEIDEHNHTDWQRWLKELRDFSCTDLDFSAFPRTLLIQGERDIIVDARQTAYFARHLANSRIELFPQAGHAPHLHDLARVRKIILAEMRSAIGSDARRVD